MEFYRVTKGTDPFFLEAFALYQESFPIYEQRKEEVQIQTLGAEAYHFELIREGDAFVGIRLYWETETFIYLEHFAISPSVRGQGIGAKALAELETKGKTVILEIDSPVDFMTGKRQYFYEEQGFVAHDFYHIHPPYRMGFDGHRLVVMAKPTITKEAYEAFFDYLQGKIMACSDFGTSWIIW